MATGGGSFDFHGFLSDLAGVARLISPKKKGGLGRLSFHFFVSVFPPPLTMGGMGGSIVIPGKGAGRHRRFGRKNYTTGETFLLLAFFTTILFTF